MRSAGRSGRGVLSVALAACVVLALLSGCADRMRQANVELRKRNQSLEARIADLERRRQADAATIRVLSDTSATRPSLSPDQFEGVFTAHGIRLGRLTGEFDDSPDRDGSDGIKVYAVPFDETGDELKAAGSFVVELFDLSQPSNPRVGSWAFDLQEARQCWYGSALLYEYILRCPWQRIPTHRELTLKVAFKDALTHREFSVQKVLTLSDPPTPVD